MPESQTPTVTEADCQKYLDSSEAKALKSCSDKLYKAQEFYQKSFADEQKFCSDTLFNQQENHSKKQQECRTQNTKCQEDNNKLFDKHIECSNNLAASTKSNIELSAENIQLKNENRDLGEQIRNLKNAQSQQTSTKDAWDNSTPEQQEELSKNESSNTNNNNSTEQTELWNQSQSYKNDSNAFAFLNNSLNNAQNMFLPCKTAGLPWSSPPLLGSASATNAWAALGASILGVGGLVILGYGCYKLTDYLYDHRHCLGFSKTEDDNNL